MSTRANKARAQRRGYGVDPVLDPLLVVSIAGVILQRSLRTVPEVLPGGAVLGDILAALALSYIGAWFFNLLVIRLPRTREKRSFAKASGHLVAEYSSTAVKIFQAMAAEPRMAPPPRSPDPDYLRDLLSQTDPMATAPRTDVAGAPFNWVQFTSSEIEASAALQRRLQAFYPQLEAETTAAIAAVENCHIGRVARLVAASPPVENPDLRVFFQLYLDLWRTCAAVGDRYLLEIAPLLRSRVPCRPRWEHPADDPLATVDRQVLHDQCVHGALCYRSRCDGSAYWRGLAHRGDRRHHPCCVTALAARGRRRVSGPQPLDGAVVAG